MTVVFHLSPSLFGFLHNYSVFFIYLQHIILTDYIPTGSNLGEIDPSVYIVYMTTLHAPFTNLDTSNPPYIVDIRANHKVKWAFLFLPNY